MKKKITFPAMGHYTEAFTFLVKELGFDPIVPEPITQETIKLGVRHSSDMVCFPFKATLGSLIQGLEKGADTILVVGVVEDDKPASCRFTYYYHIQEQILKKLGYKFDMYFLRGGKMGLGIFEDVKKINHSFGYLKTLRLLKNFYYYVKQIDEKYYSFKKKDINVGLIGEVYTLWEHGVNYDIGI